MRFANDRGRDCVVDGPWFHDLADASGGAIPASPVPVLAEHWEAARELALAVGRQPGAAFDRDDLGLPVPRPGAIFGLVGGCPTAARWALPMVFGTFPGSVCGSSSDIVVPDRALLPLGAEWTVLEAELAVVIVAGALPRLRPGDVVETSIEGIGAMRNVCRAG